MKLIIKKWGNSAAVLLPTAILTQLGVKIGDALEIGVNEQIVTLKAAKPIYKLDDLLAEMTNGFPIVEGWESI